MSETPKAYIVSVNGPVVKVRGLAAAKVADQAEVGPDRLAGEIIEMTKEVATIQVYEETTGLKPGQGVRGLDRPLSVLLGPGLLGMTFDGIQRPLPTLADKWGDFIHKGSRVPTLNQETKWRFKPLVNEGDGLGKLAIIGEVQETHALTHRIMLPPGIQGEVAHIVEEGNYTINDTIAVVRGEDGVEREVAMVHRWPVRRPREVERRLPAEKPLITGQRVIDFFFPIPKGGVAAIPGGFGTGKTVTQHQLAKWSDADVIIYIGCGERGNEMTQVLEEFPKLEDPRTGRPLMERTVLLANTSNMPVTAREASIYTGITIAEYFRDMGYDIAVMADSTSRWAEALREISGRLEQMPAEEGFPAYLASRLAEFYERGGKVRVAGDREGSISIIGAVSPPGGDFSEPVTQHTQRFVKTFWALDKALASERHFPSINWNTSYSGYLEQINNWWSRQETELHWNKLRSRAMQILQEENRLQRVVQLVGPDALPDAQRLILEVARIIKEGFLQQSAFDLCDSYSPMPKQLKMMHAILHFFDRGRELLRTGMHVVELMEMKSVERLMRMKSEVPNEEPNRLDEIYEQIERESKELEDKYGQ